MQTTFKKLFILFVFLAAGKRLLAQTNGETSFSKQAYIMQYPVSVNEQLTTVLIFPAPIASGGVDLGPDRWIHGKDIHALDALIHAFLYGVSGDSPGYLNTAQAVKVIYGHGHR